MSIRWNWKPWLSDVEKKVEDADALELAKALPSYTRGQKSRAFICYELMYQRNAPLKGWDSTQIMPACWKLKEAGFLDSCPGFGALFAPIVPGQEYGGEKHD